MKFKEVITEKSGRYEVTPYRPGGKLTGYSVYEGNKLLKRFKDKEAADKYVAGLSEEVIEEGMMTQVVELLKKEGITSKWNRDVLEVESGKEKAAKAFMKTHAIKNVKIGTLD